MMVLIVSPASTVAVMPHGGPLGGGRGLATGLSGGGDGEFGLLADGGGGSESFGAGVPAS